MSFCFLSVFEYTVAGEPCPDVQWFKGTEQLFSDARRSVAHHPDGLGSLTVWECMEEDTGLYTCRAVSALGEATCSAELLVLPEEHAVCRQIFPTPRLPLLFLGPPFLLLQIDPSYLKLKETPCVLGSSALLECKVSGSPPISVAWFRNGLKLVNGEKHQISFSDNLCILEVNSLSDSDTGTYTCKATNIAGSDECSAVLTVQGQGHQSLWMSCQAQASLLHVLSEEPLLLRLTGLEGPMSLCQGTNAISTWRILLWSLSYLM
uniref:Ig-like domain-containing protein n=1 Tax=Otus sunia TaxID=257818 RepID=A0A8C8AK76_9STRI